jgi:3-deoxy-D-manno-octulosonic-acid transferase
MSLIYSTFIHLYVLSIRIAALFNSKARTWIDGRKDIFRKIEAGLRKEGKNKKIAWFHCASLGEFEQGRPVLEAFRKKYPEFRIFLTFFSPSGYEVRHRYDQAEWVFYLPSDTKVNAKKFLNLVKPEVVFFIKYEYWFNFLDEIAVRKIPVYIVSAIFRKGQHFFTWYGGWFRKRLKKINWFFLQDDESKNLLQSIGIERCSVSGDTRFDRVFSIANQKREFEVLRKFCGDSKVFLSGSTWPEDERILLSLINKTEKIKFILAPHEVDSSRINELVAKIDGKVIKLSEAGTQDVSAYNVLVIDSIGILAYLYKYATISYIGGGFGSGIHNILEAAAFGVPVIFGPDYKKFREARDLISLGGAVSIHDYQGFESAFQKLMNDPGFQEASGKICSEYVADKKGATEKILEKI